MEAGGQPGLVPNSSSLISNQTAHFPLGLSFATCQHCSQLGAPREPRQRGDRTETHGRHRAGARAFGAQRDGREGEQGRHWLEAYSESSEHRPQGREETKDHLVSQKDLLSMQRGFRTIP